MAKPLPLIRVTQENARNIEDSAENNGKGHGGYIYGDENDPLVYTVDALTFLQCNTYAFDGDRGEMGVDDTRRILEH
ncbi:hypothetical protein RUND412_002055 [Rhizina undulata]